MFTSYLRNDPCLSIGFYCQYCIFITRQQHSQPPSRLHDGKAHTCYKCAGNLTQPWNKAYNRIRGERVKRSTISLCVHVNSCSVSFLDGRAYVSELPCLRIVPAHYEGISYHSNIEESERVERRAIFPRFRR